MSLSTIPLMSCGNDVLDALVNVNVQPFEPLTMSIKDADPQLLEEWLKNWRITHNQIQAKIDIYDNLLRIECPLMLNETVPDYETIFVRKGWLQNTPIQVVREQRVPTLIPS